MNFQEKLDYYQNNGLLLNQYYSEEYNDTSIDNKNTDNIGILSYFTSDKEVKNSYKCDKKMIINEYMCNINDKIENIKYKDYSYDKCEKCNINMCLNQISGNIICSKCGNTKQIIIMTEKILIMIHPKKQIILLIREINHFNEWLAQFQAKETTEIPENIYRDIYNELKKNINLDLKKINYKQIRDVLKKLKYNKYYDNIPHLINIISGEKAPQLNRELKKC